MAVFIMLRLFAFSLEVALSKGFDLQNYRHNEYYMIRTTHYPLEIEVDLPTLTSLIVCSFRNHL